MAVIECVETERVEVFNTAIPPEIVPVPMVTAPSLNVTVPVAVDGETAAVNPTLELKAEGLADDVRDVVVAAWLTTWLCGDDVLVNRLVSPP